jgi:hypothetical protein
MGRSKSRRNQLTIVRARRYSTTGQSRIIAYYRFHPASRRMFAQQPAAVKLNQLADAAAAGFTKKVSRRRRTDSVGGTPTDAVETTTLPKKSLRIRVEPLVPACDLKLGCGAGRPLRPLGSHLYILHLDRQKGAKVEAGAQSLFFCVCRRSLLIRPGPNRPGG